MIMRSTMIKTSEVDLDVSVDGEGNPVVLVHGYTTTSNFWWHQVPDLAKYYRTVRFDLRGHGNSGKPPDIAYDIAAFSTDLRNVLDSLDIERAAIFGLSMGGAHTIQFGLTHPEAFRYIGIFSMGLGMGGNEEDVKRYEQANAAALARSAKEMKLVYYAMGKDDFLYGTVAPTRAMLDRQKIRHVYNESGGGHTWINWRRYLEDLLPRLF